MPCCCPVLCQSANVIAYICYISFYIASILTWYYACYKSLMKFDNRRNIEEISWLTLANLFEAEKAREKILAVLFEAKHTTSKANRERKHARREE